MSAAYSDYEAYVASPNSTTYSTFYAAASAASSALGTSGNTVGGTLNTLTSSPYTTYSSNAKTMATDVTDAQSPALLTATVRHICLVLGALHSLPRVLSFSRRKTEKSALLGMQFGLISHPAGCGSRPKLLDQPARLSMLLQTLLYCLHQSHSCMPEASWRRRHVGIMRHVIPVM